ncbi:aspartate/glutamate racemase family protein [Saccharothrix sp. NRRL B-16314]|uniref:aspartate/glutamate racemase family protein n=1 Tax=Saccharothrix sp. NRRL B-16314 TaxID=1463825 RepID=UPI0005256D30|nr:aspartate/glutamate racemase family protein [Saccharothrix sp. NRRL B-16314]
MQDTRTVGVIGGMAWESSATYYRMINEKVAERLGGRHSARLLLNSTDFEEIIQWHGADDWASVGRKVTELAQGLEKGGAGCVLIACVTQHNVADEAAAEIGIPLIHIADVTGEAIVADNRRTVGLLGTRFTMEKEFFAGRLRDRFGLDVRLPDEPGRAYLHETIFEEFAKGIFTDATRARYVEIIRSLVADGAEGIILGCTEIGLLIRQSDVPDVPLYDTTELHVNAAVEFSLAKD